MKRHNNTLAAERIMDAIGMIDDHILAECSAPYRARKRARSFRAVIILAAALTLSAAMILGMFAIGFMSKKSDGAGNSAMDKAPLDEHYDAQTSIQNRPQNSEGPLDGIDINLLNISMGLELLRDDISGTVYFPEEIDLLDGSTRLVWKYADEQGYRACIITAEQLESLEKKLDSGSVNIEDSEADDVDTSLDGIWLCRDDGTVISPCLRLSDGNVGYGTLFEYDPELEPSAQFTSELLRLILKNQ